MNASSPVKTSHLNAGSRPKKATNVKKDMSRTPMAIFLTAPMLWKVDCVLREKRA
jgi:hypothetical protein